MKENFLIYKKINTYQKLLYLKRRDRNTILLREKMLSMNESNPIEALFDLWLS
jgi:hypothetical protein